MASPPPGVRPCGSGGGAAAGPSDASLGAECDEVVARVLDSLALSGDEGSGGAGEPAVAPGACAAPPAGGGASPLDAWSCAICFSDIAPEDAAVVKGCMHPYCAQCILQWAAVSPPDKPTWCPQCRVPFEYVYCHRALDGTTYDYPQEESVTLLKRARWFVGAGKAPAAEPDPAQCDYDGLFDEYDDEEDEFYYEMERQRTRGARNVVLGNRPGGSGGFMSAGRYSARPRAPPRGKGKGRAAAGEPSGEPSGAAAAAAAAQPKPQEKKLSAAAQKRLAKEAEKQAKRERAKELARRPQRASPSAAHGPHTALEGPAQVPGEGLPAAAPASSTAPVS